MLYNISFLNKINPCVVWQLLYSLIYCMQWGGCLSNQLKTNLLKISRNSTSLCQKEKWLSSACQLSRQQTSLIKEILRSSLDVHWTNNPVKNRVCNTKYTYYHTDYTYKTYIFLVREQDGVVISLNGRMTHICMSKRAIIGGDNDPCVAEASTETILIYCQSYPCEIWKKCNNFSGRKWIWKILQTTDPFASAAIS